MTGEGVHQERIINGGGAAFYSGNDICVYRRGGGRHGRGRGQGLPGGRGMAPQGGGTGFVPGNRGEPCLSELVPPVGFEPTTPALRMDKMSENLHKFQ